MQTTAVSPAITLITLIILSCPTLAHAQKATNGTLTRTTVTVIQDTIFPLFLEELASIAQR